MGCAESKLDVVSGKTIFRRKKSNPNPKKSKDIETIHETTSTTCKDNTEDSLAKEQQQPAPQINEENKDFDGAVLTDAKDSNIHENTAAKEGDHHDGEKRIIDQGKLEGVDVEEKEAAGRLISHDSPNHYFSPRKNDIDHLGISIDGINNVSEGRRSIESDYYSPSHAAGKEDHLLSENVKADHDAVLEGKELGEDNELTKEVKENGEPAVKVEEAKVIKDAQPKTLLDETKVLSNPNSDHQDQENKVVDTPTKDEISKK
ncbi:hypothetical protein F2P56_015529 [Juglans regia]|uniref:Uncharacterized protein LOC108994992 n=2 Tax=Juglans regia TaxID=51240 RepID=A0A2I4F2W8_JUGRE|nr:uncharacterized protein LOC108994992 [Juglans regia]KAF5465533.1 hypothetical protein F2P56_015529 [Juglans regia]